jgi:beta-lactamase class A
MRRSLALVTLVALPFAATPVLARRRSEPTPSPAPAPSAPPTPLSEGMRMQRLHGELEALSASAPGRLGIAVVDVRQGTRFVARGNEPFPLASVAKLAIALLVFRRADQHAFDLDRRIEVSRFDLRHGLSPIAERHPHGGASYTYAELLRAMLIESDDTASDVLLKAVGGPAAVQAFLTRANLPGFDFRKTEADIYNDAVARRTFATGADNSATPNAVANLLAGIAAQQFLRLDANNELLQLLSEVQTGSALLRAGLPPATPFAHEPGTSFTLGSTTDATNDAGIFTLPEGQRVVMVAFLGESNADVATREAVLANVARTVYRAYVP